MGVEAWTTGLWIAGVEKVVEEVFAISVKTEFGALLSLRFGVGHVLCACFQDVGEEKAVEIEFLEERVCSQLFQISKK